MANRYRLSLTPEGTKFIEVMGPQGQAVKMDLRKIEETMLGSLLDICANQAKDRRDINCCLDLAAQIEDIPGGKVELIVDDLDRKNLEKGIELSAGQRPFGWFKCRQLWKDLEVFPKVEDGVAVKPTEAKKIEPNKNIV